jgi:hypothetical protein
MIPPVVAGQTISGEGKLTLPQISMSRSRVPHHTVSFKSKLLGKVDRRRCLGRGTRVVDTLLVIFGGRVLATIGVYAAGRRFTDRLAPAPHQFWMSLLAGAVWPLLIVGLLELSSVVVLTKAQSKPRPDVGIFA